MMKRIVIGLTLAVVACAAISAQQPAAQQSTDATKGIVKSYLEIQTHLAADRFEDVKGPARTLAAQAAALGKEGTELAKAATAFAAAADMNVAREAFGPLSDAVIARVKADGSKDAAAELRLAYCPMAKRSWLQREEQLRNPYYGTKMLTCGEFKPLK
jgi:hypothetical protein